MEYKRFFIENFKGIESLALDLETSPKSSIYTFVGLNESGKTTILEALAFFNYGDRSHEALYENEYKLEYHELIPLKDKSNFNNKIKVQAQLSLSKEDKNKLQVYAKENIDFKILDNDLPDSFTISKVLSFENSTYKATNNIWDISLKGVIGRGRIKKDLYDIGKNYWLELINTIELNIPAILYFPTFLFDFPNKIYLSESHEGSELNKFYRSTIQDILDSMEGDLSIDTHIVERAHSQEVHQKRSLESLLHLMSKDLSSTIFKKWNEIFDKKIPEKQIKIKFGIDEVEGPFKGDVYLEFDIQEGDSLYLLSERSLGFRWFFCFLLFTQYRSYRKVNKGTLFILDEPASNLHSKAQNQLLNSFSKITERDCKIIYSTHSHHMINPKWLESTFIVQNAAIDYEESLFDYNRETNIIIQKYRNFVGQNPEKETYFQPILDAIEYQPSKLETIPNVIMVEGKNDYYTIKLFERLIYGEDSLSILPGTGSNDLDSLIALYKAWGRSFKIIFDSDRAGISAKETYQREWLIKNNQLFTLSDVDSNWKNHTLESLIVPEDKQMLVPNSKRISKKQLNRSIQEILASGQSLKLSEKTLNNFHSLLTFLKSELDLMN